GRVRGFRDRPVSGDRLSRRVLHRAARGALPNAVPRGLRRAVLDQLHDADARVDQPPAAQRLRESRAARPRARARADPLAERQADHGDPRSYLRLRPVHDPAAVRLARSHRRLDAGGEPGPRSGPALDLPPRHAAALTTGDPRRHRHRRAPDVRRLLHDDAAGRDARYRDDRQPDRRLDAELARADRRIAGPDPARPAPRADAALPALDLAGGGRRVRGMSVRSWLANPWARARFLWVVAIAYVAWTLLPVAIAVLFSFNATRSLVSWRGFSTRWYGGDVSSVWNDPALRSALLQSLKLSTLTVLIAVPLGVAFALALDRWRGRG